MHVFADEPSATTQTAEGNFEKFIVYNTDFQLFIKSLIVNPWISVIIFNFSFRCSLSVRLQRLPTGYRGLNIYFFFFPYVVQSAPQAVSDKI